MRKLTFILSPLLLITLLFPSLAFGVTVDDLVKRDGNYYKKFTQVPFTGKTSGRRQGLMKDGKRDGPWVYYHDKGQLRAKGTYKDGKRDGPWVGYHDNGTVDEKYTGPTMTVRRFPTKPSSSSPSIPFE